MDRSVCDCVGTGDPGCYERVMKGECVMNDRSLWIVTGMLKRRHVVTYLVRSSTPAFALDTLRRTLLNSNEQITWANLEWMVEPLEWETDVVEM